MRSILKEYGKVVLSWLNCCICMLMGMELSASEPLVPAWPTSVALERVSIDGEWKDDQARVIIQAIVKNLEQGSTKTMVAVSAQQAIFVAREEVRQRIGLRLDALQGQLKEVALSLEGEGVIREVTGAGLRSWSVRQESGGNRSLVLRFEDNPVIRSFTGVVTTGMPLLSMPVKVEPLRVAGEPAALFQGYVRIDTAAGLVARAVRTEGLIAMDAQYLPGDFSSAGGNADEPIAFRFQGEPYVLAFEATVGDPESRRVVLTDFELQGAFGSNQAVFRLTAVARVRAPQGGKLPLLGGAVAVTELGAHPGWRLGLEEGRYVFECDAPGEYDIDLTFHAALRDRGGWRTTDFQIAPSALQPFVLSGLGVDTQFEFPGGGRPERVGDVFVSHLPADGIVQLAWKEAASESEGRLFYSVEALSQLSVGPGLLRQVSWLDFKVMQGELNRVIFDLEGEGEVTRVLGPQVLAWTIEPASDRSGRRLAVQLNQGQKTSFSIEVQLQSALGVFPLTLKALRLQPEGATRYGGHVRVINDGAVRLEVVDSAGLSQVSPEQFPVSDANQNRFAMTGAQQFVYRFSGAEFDLQIRADNILPELGVSQLLVYRLGETEMAIDGELELEIREAPLRELILKVPRDFTLARLNASGLSDYFVSDASEPGWSDLRLVYGAPVEGRQVVQLRLERNRPLEESGWALPRVEVEKARSVRGHVGVVAEPGYRLTPTLTSGLADVATAFFPRKEEGLQAAFRVREANWQVTLGVERLPQSIQAEVFHLFSIGEGIAYGSSVIHYLIAGAPVSAFDVELSPEYFNVEFTGKDVRNWQKTSRGFQVQLHAPVAGAYTLLVTYERPFRSQGETLTFTGAQPRDAQSEQGHTLVISGYQFQVRPENVSTNLLRLEPAEVPAEYRLFFDAPILAAYRYSNRPFMLDLALQPLVQGETVGQVIDRARLTTRISKEGQILTDIRYYLKNKGAPHLQLNIPTGQQLWSVTVNGTTVVPVTTSEGNSLIPLPLQGDPGAVQVLDIKMAGRSPNARHITLEAPSPGVPVLLAEWNLEPEVGRRLVYRGGSLTPADPRVDDSGFAGLLRLIRGHDRTGANLKLGISLVLVLIGTLAWRWAARESNRNVRYWSGLLLGGVAGLAALIGFVQLAGIAGTMDVDQSRSLGFMAPVQQVGSHLVLRVTNHTLEDSWLELLWRGWPIGLGLAIWVLGMAKLRERVQKVAWLAGWLFLFWGMLRSTNGAVGFLLIFIVFLVIQIMIPMLRRLLAVPRRLQQMAGATAILMVLAGLGLSGTEVHANQASAAAHTPLAESFRQNIRVDKGNVLGTVRVRWLAKANQVLPILRGPAMMTGIDLDREQLKLVRLSEGDVPTYALMAMIAGDFDFTFRYETEVNNRDGEPGFLLPTGFGLINEASLMLAGVDMEVKSSQAVSVQLDPAAAPHTHARLLLASGPEAWISWVPRRRDTRLERAVFFAEWTQRYAPAAGVIEGAHRVQIRPAQGELEDVEILVPQGMTISQVSMLAGEGIVPEESGRVAFWRFDPDEGRLRVGLAPSQAKPFALVIESQTATGPLPYDKAVGVLAINGASGEVGMLGIATGNEVQLEQVSAEGSTPINLEDFGASTDLIPSGLTLRRAYRYSDTRNICSMRAVAVEPDVRVDAQQTLSLGEDRVLLAATLKVEINRAGVFKLSFRLPPSFDVESISGPALSHWTELGEADERVVTLHFKGKTEGQQAFSVSLAGPGIRAAQGWSIPRLTLIEAAKQQGQLLVVPERGMRLIITTRDGVTQLDPERAGVREKGVLAFRLLHESWQLTVDVEQVDAWIQVSSLQDVTLTDAQVRVIANLQYQIENTSIKTLRVSLPTSAQGVQFRGGEVADFFVAEDQSDAGADQAWEIRLHRRVIGAHLLQVSFHLPATTQTSQLDLKGVRALNVNLQRGYVTLRTSGRLRAQVTSLPEELQPTEWQVIPRALQQDIAALPANMTYRLVAPEFVLPVTVQRHQATQLLAARVDHVELTSVIADNGAMLTRVQLGLIPGDKRLLEVRLPAEAQFWFAFVNQNSVWPWLGDQRILLPLEQRSQTSEATAVEFFYASQVRGDRGRALDLSLLGPQFDLPLENITWRVYLSPKWEVADWSGTMELRGQEIVGDAKLDLDTYLRNEGQIQQLQTRQAEELLSMANSLLQRGDPGQARRAFQAAYGLSQHDEAFNEDARVQLHNMKLQQALVGLNLRQAAVSGRSIEPIPQLPAVSEGREPVYTQDQALRILSRNSAEENEFQNRLVERLIQQQDAAGASPVAIRATIPEQGRLLTFARALQVDPWVDLRIDLETNPVASTSIGNRFALLLSTLVVLSLLAWAAGFSRTSNSGH